MQRNLSLIVLMLGSMLALSSCATNTNSGPCDYTEEKFNMRIIDVSEDAENKDMFVVLVDFDGNISYAEGQHTLAEIRDVTTNFDFIINNHIKVGNIYTGTVHTRVGESTHCEEQIIDWDQKLLR